MGAVRSESERMKETGMERRREKKGNERDRQHSGMEKLRKKKKQVRLKV